MDVINLARNGAALQQSAVTIGARAHRMLWSETPPWGSPVEQSTWKAVPNRRRLIIRGVTRSGRIFRPSDWAERLAGAMSSFRPGRPSGGIGQHIGYSPLCVPRVLDGVKSVLVDEALRAIEPMAWDFVINFARDNDLQVVEPKRKDVPKHSERNA